MSDWYDIRRQARRDVHAAFSVSAEYNDSSLAEPVELQVRWHNRFGVPTGDIAGGDYAQVIETIDRIVFDIDELTEKSVTPRRGGQVTLTDYDKTFTLDVREPNSGPGVIVWTVAN